MDDGVSVTVRSPLALVLGSASVGALLVMLVRRPQPEPPAVRCLFDPDGL